jgi:hypothetical protein
VEGVLALEAVAQDETLEPPALEAVAQDEAQGPLIAAQPPPAGTSAAAPGNEPVFAVVSIPGRFPPAFRKIRVR